MQTCCCKDNPWLFLGKGKQTIEGFEGWERGATVAVFGLEQHVDDGRDFYCDRCGCQLHPDGTASAQRCSSGQSEEPPHA